MKKGAKRQILAVVSGGVLNAVYVSPDLLGAEVTLFDYDDKEAEGMTSAQRTRLCRLATKNMEEIY